MEIDKEIKAKTKTTDSRNLRWKFQWTFDQVYARSRLSMKDAWEELSTDEPRETTFFKLVEFCYLQGLDLKENMPAPDRLLEAEELG